MVFPSVPAYLDPPNWNNQQAHQPRTNAGGGGGNDASQLPMGSMPAAAPPEGIGAPSSSAGAAAAQQQPRPNSMAERARMARAPQPEPALRCPRCDSTNTKFCYYNNYSLSQPRHFCKACRRYWTRGGALRNVPVGGGCRRNRRASKSSAASSSKSSARQLPGGPSSSSAAVSTSGPTGAVVPPGLTSIPHHQPFLGAMHHHHLPDLGQPGPNLGLTFSPGIPPLGLQNVGVVDQFPVASGGGATIGSASLEQWRVQQQFPFLGGGLDLPPPPPMYQLDLEGSGAAGSAAAAYGLGQTSTITERQAALVKMEDSKAQQMSLQTQFMAAIHQRESVWPGGSAAGDGGSSGSGASWWTTNIPGFHSSSTGGDGGGGLL